MTQSTISNIVVGICTTRFYWVLGIRKYVCLTKFPCININFYLLYISNKPDS